MLGLLHGQVAGRLGQRLLVEVNGVGYWVYTGSWQPEGEVTCYLYHHVREEASDLYGFASLPALSLFEQLISISGIGPKAGLAILSLGPIERIQQAIANKESTYLSQAPGIGQKAAQKILLELQGKVVAFSSEGGLPSSAADITSVLESLGYRSADIQPLLGQLPLDLTLDQQIKWALQQLGRS